MLIKERFCNISSSLMRKWLEGFFHSAFFHFFPTFEFKCNLPRWHVMTSSKLQQKQVTHFEQRFFFFFHRGIPCMQNKNVRLNSLEMLDSLYWLIWNITVSVTCLMIIRPNVVYIFEILLIFHVFTFYWNQNLNVGAIVVCLFIAVCESLWMSAVYE